ncbi:MAG: nucleotidyltransferase domain-containing protein [Oscillospiraceae bacterium]|nr:nucleotidyltransferase domain-containing protein [Oscillospiraceae bacterium]
MYQLSDIKRTVEAEAVSLPIEKVVLVGSYAKNEATETSDIDLVIDGKDLSDAYWDFLFRLEDTFEVKVDLMTFRGLKNSCLRDSVLESGITLYEV